MLQSTVLHRPLSIENKYLRQLSKENNYLIKDMKENIYPFIKNNYFRLDEFKTDGFAEDISALLEELNVKYGLQVLGLIATLDGTANQVRDFVIKGIYNSLKGVLGGLLTVESPDNLAINIFNRPNAEVLQEITESWALNNAMLIKSIPEKLLYDVSIVIQEGFRQGQSMTTLTENIQSRFNVSRSRARLIARDQIGKLNSNYIRAEYNQLDIKMYKWITSHDDRVRKPSHKVMEGKYCIWSDPTVYKDSPTDKHWKKRSSIGGVEKQIGEDYQCRCTCSAVL